MAILTVSREFGSGGREISQAVASQMNYQYVDKQIILSDLKAAGNKWEKWGEALDEHCPTVWEKYDWSFRGFSALIQSCILNYALKDRVVIMGRGGNFLLKGIPSAFSIRFIAPIDKRIEKIITRESVDRKTAKWLTEKTDSARACFIRSIYSKEWDDPAEFDRVFDTSAEDVETIIKVIKLTLSQREKAAKDIKLLRMRAEAARVKAALLTNPKLFVPTLDVFHEGQGIVIRGVVHSAKEHKAVEEEARRLAEDMPVRCELHYRK
ncbi:MAG: cytidylate kinase-like family protein [Nitrospirae bacterium]|nr:cytidylate kinase-like family protein [Nitrospirota bacterium]